MMSVDDGICRVFTLVNLHGRKGALYMKAIKPFHRFVATKIIEHALKAGHA
ncbi:MAG: hypothetical protein CSB44_10720 [Gammaproteobacteria bacterium]|nr:MAG: hypothetical protein CSB44_10720 [Gammaproteobacteria bacterium]